MKRRSKGTRKSSSRRPSKPRSNAWKAVSLMRSNDIPARRAAGAAGVSRSTLIRRGGSALKKLKSGRYVAKRNDHLFRPVIVVSENGPVEVATRNFREASKAGKHSSAVERYLETGDDSALRQFRGKYVIDAQGDRVALLTDTDELDRQGSAGELSFESLYARSR
jgi:hypothetical protein